jgi:hypothetical protein
MPKPTIVLVVSMVSHPEVSVEVILAAAATLDS